MRGALFRHGATADTLERRYPGQDLPLCAAGREQVRQTAAALHEGTFARKAPRFLLEPEMPPAQPGRAPLLFVSPCRRCIQTAQLLFPHAACTVMPALREMDFGIFGGHHFPELAASPAYRAWVEGGCTGQIPGGEDMEGYIRRVTGCFRQILRQAADRRCDFALIAHDGTAKAILSTYAVPRPGYFEVALPPGGGMVLEFR